MSPWEFSPDKSRNQRRNFVSDLVNVFTPFYVLNNKTQSQIVRFVTITRYLWKEIIQGKVSHVLYKLKTDKRFNDQDYVKD